MTWIEPVSTAVTAAELLKSTIESSSAIKRFARRLAYRVRNGQAVVPVFGAGGVGKTTVSKLLVGADPMNIAAPYQESGSVEPRQLKGDVPGQILAAPGQKTRIPANWPALFKKLATKESFGLINVVAYGYHSLMLQSYREHDVYKKGMTPASFVDAYTKARRDVELELLETLLDGMSAVNHPIWMVTLITKQDLWWEQRSKVRDHYMTGDYGRKIENLRNGIGDRNFQHEFIPVSLTLSSLSAQDGEVFAATTAGYDLPIHQRYRVLSASPRD